MLCLYDVNDHHRHPIRLKRRRVNATSKGLAHPLQLPQSDSQCDQFNSATNPCVKFPIQSTALSIVMVDSGIANKAVSTTLEYYYT